MQLLIEERIQERADTLQISCPQCGAAPRESCRRVRGGPRAAQHQARWNTLKRAAEESGLTVRWV